MAKKAAPRKSAKPAAKGMSADDHRKAASMLRAKGRMHEARADMMDVLSPPKGKRPMPGMY